jgi:hypothetical protein
MDVTFLTTGNPDGFIMGHYFDTFSTNPKMKVQKSCLVQHEGLLDAITTILRTNPQNVSPFLY